MSDANDKSQPANLTAVVLTFLVEPESDLGKALVGSVRDGNALWYAVRPEPRQLGGRSEIVSLNLYESDAERVRRSYGSSTVTEELKGFAVSQPTTIPGQLSLNFDYAEVNK